MRAALSTLGVQRMFKFLSTWQNGRKLKAFEDVVKQIATLEGLYKEQPPEELSRVFAGFKAQVAAGEAIDSLVPHIFATIRAAAQLTLKLRPYDVQVLGGLVLNSGAIAQMATGEGKTITAAFAVFVQHLKGHQVHICTANEYLAQRDANSLLKLYRLMGLTVGVIRMEQTPEDKRLVYTCDVVYGTHGAFAMDYLADHLARHPAEILQSKGLGFALVDEADSVLIDDARVPVTLTSQRPANEALYTAVAGLSEKLRRAADAEGEGDFFIDGKNRQAVLTEAGYDTVTTLMVEARLLPADEQQHYTAEHHALLHKVTAALAVQHILHLNQHYVVKNGAIVLVDELTGRLMPSRSWDGGIQQALEAKEGLPLSPESSMLGRIAVQHFFKLYKGMAGMTGTAVTEAQELLDVYGLEVVEIPTNKPCVRCDAEDRFYRTEEAKVEAVLAEIQFKHAAFGQPILVGTTSIEQSQAISDRLNEMGLSHEMLNAKEHEREAEIMAQAGKPGSITVTTNMSGRGVDIILGGNPDVELRRRWSEMGEAAWDALTADEQRTLVDDILTEQRAAAAKARSVGGLHVIGMERYESRRIDQQLRGRAGRQGEAGSSCFFISFEDPLVENFAGERLRGLLAKLDIQPGDELESALVRQSIDSAQRQVEGRAMEARKQLMQYDEVLDDQRKAFYGLRDELLQTSEIQARFGRVMTEQVERLCDKHASHMVMQENWTLDALSAELRQFGVVLTPDDELRDLDSETLLTRVKLLVDQQYAIAAGQVPADNLDNAIRYVILSVLDQHWFTHLEELSELRRGIGLRVHAKVDPQQAFKREAFELFGRMLESMKSVMVSRVVTWEDKSKAA